MPETFQELRSMQRQRPCCDGRTRDEESWLLQPKSTIFQRAEGKEAGPLQEARQKHAAFNDFGVWKESQPNYLSELESDLDG